MKLSRLWILVGLALIGGIWGWLRRSGLGSKLPSPHLASSAAEPGDSSWFPIEPGKVWTYEARLGSKVLGKKRFHCLRKRGEDYLVEEYTDRIVVDRGRLRLGPKGWRHLKYSIESKAVRLFLPPSLEPGQSWIAVPGDPRDSLRGQVDARIGDWETLEVPALSQPIAAVRVDLSTRLRPRGERQVVSLPRKTRWWAPGVGVVRERYPFQPSQWKTEVPASSDWVELNLVSIEARRESREARVPGSPGG